MDTFKVLSEIFHFQLGPLSHVEEDTYPLAFHSIQTMRPVLLWQEFQIAETLNLIQVLLLTARLLHCALCQKNVRSYNRAIACDVCTHWCHIKCGEISLREYRRLQNIQNFDWTCPSGISTLRTLPFADISNLDSSDGSFTSHGEDSCTDPASQQTLAWEDYLENLSRILNYSSKDLRVAHLNICSLRYKIDELRLLQRICGFDILGISETHLDSSVPDNFLQIDGLQLIRRDRTKCKGGGVALCYAEHLTAVHHKDLLVRNIEAIWMQVKFPTHTTLFSVV